MTKQHKPSSHTSHHMPGALEIGHTTPLRRAVWTVRRMVRELVGSDVLDPEKPGAQRRHRIRHVYRQVDEFAAAFFPRMVKTTPKKMAMARVKDMIAQLQYTVVESDEAKPWGAYYRLADEEAERFLSEFFPGLTMNEAKLGQKDVKLSPKFLLVSPGQQLSWQYHHRRAERWHFLLRGAYHKNTSDKQGDRIEAPSGTIVQFATGERHRLCAADDHNYSLVAEVWQHTDPANPSDESDIIRLADDYAR